MIYRVLIFAAVTIFINKLHFFKFFGSCAGIDDDTYYDGFIVEDHSGTTPKMHANAKTIPSIGSMALSLTRKTHSESSIKENAGRTFKKHVKFSARHIDPKINLEKTLTMLANSTNSKRSLELPYEKQNNSKGSNDSHIHFKTEKNNIHSNDSKSIKKHAQHNVITDPPIKGFLSKDKNYTIQNVSNTRVDQKAKDQKLLQIVEKFENHMAKKNNTLKNYFSSDPSISQYVKTLLINKVKFFIEKSEENLKKTEKHTQGSTLIKADQNPKHIEKHLLPVIKISSLNKTTIMKNVSQQSENITNHKINQGDNIKENKSQDNISSTSYVDLHAFNPDDFDIIQTLNSTTTEEKGFRKDTVDTYYENRIEPECSDKKKCDDENKYCSHFHCIQCHRNHHECNEHKQCCDGIPCIYGRCDAKPKGSPGSLCESDEDCGDNGCCVIEPTIDEEHGICKQKLEEYHQCSPVLFRKVWVGDEKPKCGPCKKGLECVEKGVLASHLVCMKDKK